MPEIEYLKRNKNVGGLGKELMCLRKITGRHIGFCLFNAKHSGFCAIYTSKQCKILCTISYKP